MKKIFTTKVSQTFIFALFLALISSIFTSCSSDDEPIDEEELAKQEQEQIYQSTVKEIVGSWDAYEVWKSTYIYAPGWYPISYISWDTTNWTFNADGTGYEENKIHGKSMFQYTIFKNPKYKLYNAPVLVDINYNEGIDRTFGVEITDNLLRLYPSSELFGYPYESCRDGGESAVRYKKK